MADVYLFSLFFMPSIRTLTLMLAGLAMLGPFAIDTYKELEAALGIDIVQTKSIIDFFPSVQMREAFVTRITEDDTFVHSYPDQNHFNQFFNYDFGSCGFLKCY